MLFLQTELLNLIPYIWTLFRYALISFSATFNTLNHLLFNLHLFLKLRNQIHLYFVLCLILLRVFVFLIDFNRNMFFVMGAVSSLNVFAVWSFLNQIKPRNKFYFLLSISAKLKTSAGHFLSIDFIFALQFDF